MTALQLIPNEKPCGHCKIVKAAAEFHHDRARKDRLSSWCRLCDRIKRETYKSRDPEKVLENQRRRTARYVAGHREAQLVRVRNSALKHKFGIDIAEYNRMLVAQNGVCATCRRPNTQNGRRLHVDHCHATGKVRGLLCHGCNLSLGHCKDSPLLLRALADYLERSI